MRASVLCVTSTLPLDDVLWHMSTRHQHNLSGRKIRTERWLHCVNDSTPHAFLGFASSGNHPISFLFFFCQFPVVGQITLLLGRKLLFRKSCCFFFLRRTLFLHFFLLRFLAFCVRHAPWSQHPRVDAAIRLHLVAAHFTPQFHVTSRSYPLAASNDPASSVARAAAFAATALLLRFRSAAAALILLTCLALGAPHTLHCNCCLTYNYRVSDFAYEHASSISFAFRFSSACRTPLRDVEFPHHPCASCEVNTSYIWVRPLCH